MTNDRKSFERWLEKYRLDLINDYIESHNQEFEEWAYECWEDSQLDQDKDEPEEDPEVAPNGSV